MSAIFDPTRVYRYELRRLWLTGEGTVCFVMLNPSTADAEANDPTVTGCITFASNWGFQQLVVVNLYAYRSTDPDKLREVLDPVGQENDDYILRAVDEADLVVAAWGTKSPIANRSRDVARMIATRKPIHILRLTKKGHPEHPLYIPRVTRPSMWIEHLEPSLRLEGGNR